MARELQTFEHLLRDCYASAGRLGAAAIETQMEHQLSVVAGHQVLTAIAAAQGEVAGAIVRSAEAHRLIEALGKRLGLDTTAYGVEGKDPGPGVFFQASSSLRAVA